MSSLENTERRLIIIQQLLDKLVVPDIICPVCGNYIRLYVPYGKPLRRNALCPACQALERHRFLWKAMNLTQYQSDIRLLHFAPEKCFYDKFSVMSKVDYFPVDYNSGYNLKLRNVVDIQNIPYEDNYFDVIICDHVLEHIPDDEKAVEEIYRVLKPQGKAFIMVPLTGKLKSERTIYDSPEERTEHYGQHDHLRNYGDDFAELLSPFNVEVLTPQDILTYEDITEFCLLSQDKLFVCCKVEAI